MNEAPKLKRMDAIAERELRKFNKRWAQETPPAGRLTQAEELAFKAGARSGYLSAKREDAANLNGQAAELSKAIPRARIMTPTGAKTIQGYIRILEATADNFRREPNEEVSEPEITEAIDGDDEAKSEGKAGSEAGGGNGARPPEGDSGSAGEARGPDQSGSPRSGLKLV